MRMTGLKAGILAGAIALAATAAALAAGGPAANVDLARMTTPSKNAGQWLSVGRTYDEQRFSPLTQINDKTIKDLGLAWYADMPVDRGVEASPLEIDGVLYNVEPWNATTAYDAKTGKQLWRYDPKVPREKGRLACCDIVSRGLAAWKGRIYVATLDGRLISLDAKTGKPIWTVDTFDPVWPYTITGAPRVFNGMVLIGNGGAEHAARGYVTAYDWQTGKKLWRFYTVPGDPSKPQPNSGLEMAAKTWTGEFWKTGGGGTVWDSMVYDPKLDLIYIGVGNGGPWVQSIRSPEGGENLFLGSVVALKGKTGEYVWHYQETPGDEWDYTSTQPMVLADLTIDGKVRKVLLHAPKNGFFYVLDRATGQLISAQKYVPTNWAFGVDMKTGKAMVNPEARYTEVPVLISPSPAGGHNWQPMSFSPITGLAYFPVTQNHFGYSRDPKFVQEPGKTGQLGIGTTGYDLTRKAISDYAAANDKTWLTAWDPAAQKERWRVPYPRRGSGGTLVTAGNLVFQGTINTTFAAYRADTGEKVWEMPVHQVPMAGPITYVVDGEQYIAVNAGWGGGTAAATAATFFKEKLQTPRLLVFKLGGKASLPATAADSGLQPPPPSTASAEQISEGEKLFAANCSGCHGPRVSGGLKDLRVMSPQTHAEFFDIVLGGKRAERGMASFAGILNHEQAEAIHAYIIKRANEDWPAIKAATGTK